MENNKKVKIKRPLTKGVAKVPVVIQMEALECGAASLAMICAYYNKWIPLEQIRVDCGVSRDGANAKNLLVAARSYGFTAKGYRYEPDDLKKTESFLASFIGISITLSYLTDSREKRLSSTTPPRAIIPCPWRPSTSRLQASA